MRIDCALLCDAATVREGLLHILGAGITRAGRPAFPAPVDLTLALRILVHPTELNRPHELEVRLQGADGEGIGGFVIGFESDNPGGLEPGEHVSLPLPIVPPPDAQLPGPGRYSFEVLIDGVHQATVPFIAHQIDAPELLQGDDE